MSIPYVLPLISILSLLISIITFLYLKSWLRRRTAREWVLSEIQDELNKMLNSLDETTVRDISLIEEREKKIKSLLAEIDKRLKVYIREIDKRREADENYTALSQAIQDKNHDENAYLELGKNRYNKNKNVDSPEIEQDGEDTAFPLPRFRVKQETITAAGTPAASAPYGVPEAGAEVSAAGQASADTPALRTQIRELAHAGLPTTAIASRLGISIAEVEFVTALLGLRDEEI